MVSGTFDEQIFRTREVIDDAYSRIGIKPQQISAELLERALKQLRIMLAALATRVLPLWAQDHKLIAIPVGKRGIPMPPGTIDVMGENGLSLRQLAHRTGVQAVDPTTGVRTHGMLNTQAVSIVGIALDADQTADLVIETAREDLSLWTTQLVTGDVAWRAGGLQWFEFEPVDCQHVRVRAVSGNTPAIQLFKVSGSPYDLPLSRMSHDSYQVLPNKDMRGRPVQYWLDRQASRPVVMLWPTLAEGYEDYCLSLWRQRHIMDVGGLNDQIEMPLRWIEYLVTNLAARLMRVTPEANKALAPDVALAANEALVLVSGDERDSSPTTKRSSSPARTT